MAKLADHHAGSDTLMRMQLTALGMSSWLSRARCCGCFPISLAGIFVCVFLLLSGGVALYETLGEISFYFTRYNPHNPYVLLARTLYGWAGIVDVALAVVGVFGIVFRLPIFALALTTWLVGRLVVGAYILLCVAMFNTMDVSWSVGFVYFFVAIAVSLYCVFVSLELLLVVTLRGSVSEQILELLLQAQSWAQQDGSQEIAKVHVVAAMFQDQAGVRRLQDDGCDTEKIRQWIDMELQQRGCHPGFQYHDHEQPEDHVQLLFTSDATEFLSEACWLQREVGDSRLTQEHFFLALLLNNPEVIDTFFQLHSGILTSYDQLNHKGRPHDEHHKGFCELMTETMSIEAAKRRALTLKFCQGFCFHGPADDVWRPTLISFMGHRGEPEKVTVHPSDETGTNWTTFVKIRDSTTWAKALEVKFSHETQPDEASPGATILGCLPLEETVLVYIIVDMCISVVSLTTLFFLDRCIGALVGLRTYPMMRQFETFIGVTNIIVSGLAIRGIFAHRWSRWNLKDQALHFNVPWKAELDEAYDAVRSQDQEEADKLLKGLKLGANLTGVLLFWNVLRIFLNIPVWGMALMVGNVCGSYVHGIANVHTLGMWPDHAPMRCTTADEELLLLTGFYFVVLVYFTWAMLALWHQYAFGWTTTDQRGLAYLDPLNPAPESCIRFLMGIPRYAKRAAGDPEAKPLML
jgi:hypothetical protein